MQSRILIIILSLLVATSALAQDVVYYVNSPACSLTEDSVYALFADSSVAISRRAEQWVTPMTYIGKWSQSGKIVRFTTYEFDTTILRLDTIGHLVYLIPDIDKESHTRLLTKIVDCAAYDPLAGFNPVVDDEKEELEIRRRIQYQHTTECLCGDGVWIEMPSEFVHQRHREKPRRRRR